MNFKGDNDNEVLSIMSEFIGYANHIVWGNLLTYMLIFSGLYFSLCTRFIQFRRLRYSFSVMLGSRQRESEDHISSFQAFCTSLAARVGTGNMAGVAVAIHLGGPGAVFWMWLIALIGMSTSLVENTLAQLYKINQHDGSYVGGPSYYIEKALHARWGGTLFSIALILAFGFAFNTVQANSISAALEIYDIPPTITGITLACLTGMVILGGIHSIARFAEFIVPGMAVFYLIIAIGVVVMNLSAMPDIIILIIKSAFGLESTAAGGIGYSMKMALEHGIKRGLFSNEAGMGSSPNAAATATPHPNHPVIQGLMGMIGVFTDTIIICTATAAIILLSGEYATGYSGIALTQIALRTHIGMWGQHIVAIAIFLFAFTTLITNYYYGESNIRFIFRDKAPINAYRIAVLFIIVLGAVSELNTVWSLADLTMGLMAIINLISILILSKHVFMVVKDFEEQLDADEPPKFNRFQFPFLDKTIDKDVWSEH